MSLTDTQRAIQALQTGNNDELNEMGGDSTLTDEGVEESGADESDDLLSILDDARDVSSEDDQSEQDTTDGEESAEDTEDPMEVLDEEKQEAAPEKELPATEVIKADGKKIKIDYSDRNSIRRAFAAQAGMRKFQRERDDAYKKLESQKEEVDSYRDLNKLYQTAGVDGVVERLEGKSLDDIINERIDRMIMREENPSEAAKLDYEDKLAAERKAREALEARITESNERVAAEREAAEEAKLAGLITPVFQRHSFSGKLGDEVAEHQMDQALWDQALARLEEYEEDQLTPAIIRKEFRTVANTFNKIITKQARKQAKEVSTKRKREAKEHVQAQVAAGTTNATSKSDWAKKFKSGDMTGSPVDLMTGKVKL